MTRLSRALALFFTVTIFTAATARADFFDMNNNGIPDFVDPTSPTYWTTGAGSCNTTYGGGNGGGGGKMPTGVWFVIGGVTIMVFSPFLAIACDDPHHGDPFVTYDHNGEVVKFLKFAANGTVEYSADVWCGTKKIARDLRDWIKGGDDDGK